MRNFHKVSDNVTRGGDPTAQDIYDLKKGGVSRIISLDQKCADKIERPCKLLGLEHIIIPLNASDKKSIKHLFKHSISDLFSVPVFVHCRRGRDRTGFLIALHRCINEGWDCRKSLTEAKELGFGTGMEFPVEKYCTKLIQSACSHDHKEDENAAYDIVSGAHDQNQQYRDYTLDYYGQQSFAPYADYNIRGFPYAATYYNQDNYNSRQNYGLKSDIDMTKSKQMNQIPQVGVYDGSTVMNGTGPSLIGGGFIW